MIRRAAVRIHGPQIALLHDLAAAAQESKGRDMRTRDHLRYYMELFLPYPTCQVTQLEGFALVLSC